MGQSLRFLVCRGILSAAIAVAATHAFAQRGQVSGSTASAPAAASVSKAEAKLDAKNNSKISGTIDFEQTSAGMKVSYLIEGLAPMQKQGFHIHEKGDCTSADAKSAGPHFAMTAKGGGTSMDFPDEYAGDLPELQANEKGKAEGSFLMPRISFAGQYSILDRAIIVHGKADDTTKKSAPRVACGVIKATGG